MCSALSPEMIGVGQRHGAAAVSGCRGDGDSSTGDSGDAPYTAVASSCTGMQAISVR